MLRAAVFSAVCVVLAGAGHTFASCASVPLWTLFAGFLGVLACAAPLAGRTRSLPGIVVLLAVGQTVLHTLFGLGQHMTSAASVSPAAATADTTLVARAARLLCGVPLAAISPAQAQRILADARISTGGGTGAGTGGGAGMDMGSMSHTTDAVTSAGSVYALLPTLPMLLGHVLAAVATGWLLRRGDLALLRLMRLSAHGVAEGALVRSLRGALALARALRTGLPGTPGTASQAPRAWTLVCLRPSATALQHTVIRRGPPASSLVLAA
ncbi:putative lipoprotein [Streptomyces turgidiscabies Car8]|uniref:Putative lipoprotein n=2 Tax=Streptomyces turgidiscabies TaxID=85558 RepID=L7EYS5_STRT8|nr:putative lipoprotein [Streptomyces turgidiscabies Car8]GAQ69641.1 hypothetical protein T45_01369 [Streptomyces turgidiscabies]